MSPMSRYPIDPTQDPTLPLGMSPSADPMGLTYAPEIQHPMHAMIAPISAAPPKPSSMLPDSGAPKQMSAIAQPAKMSPLDQREEQLQQGLQKKPQGFLGNLAHYAGMAGRIAGDIVAPGQTETIVGTLGREGIGPRANEMRNEQISDIEKQKSEQGLQGAQTNAANAHTEELTPVSAPESITAAHPELADLQLPPNAWQRLASTMNTNQGRKDISNTKNSTVLAKEGYKLDENGEIIPMKYEEMSPAQQSSYDLKNSQKELADSTETLREAQAEVERAKNDPNSPAYKIAEQRLAVARQNAQAAGTRAQAYMGRYLQSAFNTDLRGNYLPGAPQIENERGNVTVVGTGNAAQARQAQASAAQFNDVHGALDSIEQTAQKLTDAGGKLNSPQVIAALQSPHATISQWVHSINKANLSPEERDYVMSNIALHENIQGLRKSAGGAATDAQVENLLKMAPSGSTPDLDYLKRQSEQIRQTAERLGKGVTTARGGLNVRGQNANQPSVNANPARPSGVPATAKYITDPSTGKKGWAW